MNKRKMYAWLTILVVTVIVFIFYMKAIVSTQGFYSWPMWLRVLAIFMGSITYLYSAILGIGGLYFVKLLIKDRSSPYRIVGIFDGVEGIAIIFQLVFWGVLRSNIKLYIVAGLVAVIGFLLYIIVNKK